MKHCIDLYGRYVVFVLILFSDVVHDKKNMKVSVVSQS